MNRDVYFEYCYLSDPVRFYLYCNANVPQLKMSNGENGLLLLESVPATVEETPPSISGTEQFCQIHIHLTPLG